MRSCVAGRLLSAFLLLLVVLLLGALAPTKAADEDRFLTNLALLDALADEAVEQILDSLGVAAGDSIAVLADGYNEGNDFIADAFARSLARRGCSVRMLAEMAAPPPEAPGGAGGKTPADTDSLPPDSDEEDGDQGDQQDDDDGEDQPFPDDDQGDDDDDDDFGSDLFVNDTTAAGDSTDWGMEDDTLATGEDDAGKTPDDDTDEDEQTPEIPTGSQSIAAGRAYPPGDILEFQVLEFGVTYPEVKRRFMVLGASSVRRLAGVYVQARRIEGPEGEIVHVATGQSHREDRLSGRSRILAEGAGYPFEAPTVPPGRIKKLAEPMVVLGIVASLVYLFYQNQN